MRNDVIEIRPSPDHLETFAGQTLLVARFDGVVRGDGLQGLYYRNTRILSTWLHHLGDGDFNFVAASAVESHSSLQYYLAPQPLEAVSGLKSEEPGLAVRVSRSLSDGMHEDVDVENYTQRAVNCELRFEIEADFADIAEAKEGRRQQEAPVDASWCDESTDEPRLVMRYRHPELDRAVVVLFRSKSKAQWRDGRVVFQLDLPPRAHAHVCAAVAPLFDGRSMRPTRRCYEFRRGDASPRRCATRVHANATRLTTPNSHAQATWNNAIRDLKDLAMNDGDWPGVITPAAGIPMYQALFGRDALTASWQSAMATPVLMEASLASTTRYIGGAHDDFRDEAPGRIAQQVNFGPLAALGRTPFARYYGDLAAPSDFLIVLGQHYAWTGDEAVVRRYYDAAERVLDWLDNEATQDDGFVWYDTRSSAGQKNQGWKDSSVAVVYEDGRGVQNPIASSELQGYLYAGKQQYAIAVALAMRKFGRARELLRQAAALRQRFNAAFWMEDEQYIAFALDPERRPVRSIASNAGHCLATGIVEGRHAKAIAARLMAEDMFSGWGIRTLSSAHPAYNPFSYQLGSVWPVENATAAFGLKRYGFHEPACRLAGAMFDAARLFPQHRLPEVIGGYPRDDEHPHPGVYPRAQSPQAWSASAIPMFLQAILGLRPFAPLRTLLVDPVLPDWLPELTLSNLRVGDARVSLRFHRERDGTTGWKVTERHGTLFVVQQPPESSIDGTVPRRAKELLASFVPWLH